MLVDHKTLQFSAFEFNQYIKSLNKYTVEIKIVLSLEGQKNVIGSINEIKSLSNPSENTSKYSIDGNSVTESEFNEIFSSFYSLDDSKLAAN